MLPDEMLRDETLPELPTVGPKKRKTRDEAKPSGRVRKSKAGMCKYRKEPSVAPLILAAVESGGIWTSSDLHKLSGMDHYTREHLRDVAVWMIRFGGYADRMKNFHVLKSGPNANIKRTVAVVDTLDQYSKRKISPHEKVCRLCGLHGGFENVQSVRCYSCGEEKKSSLSESIANDPRWKRIIEKAHGTRGNCLVCGSYRAVARDGRYCHWTHDVTMLNEQELQAVLEQYGMPEDHYDMWGRVRESAATR